ncbi:hypothetical protein LOTGIDRAFT_108079 [Lottia gigantea]|uniref:protein acetyllysine N-acetyltransferase n=1 Tax=Lottia gigantea TaxID=225164 RepID=V3ZNN2_LOTGI|nr:hypothetical protein LOTGIDRAFT_108079 [Lottia gigantea]ESO84090.1 hypothetical protein LOTGIDRAFT_108079 [Lottia gigantea]
MFAGPMSWVHRQVSMGTDPRSILTDMLPDGMELPSDLDNYSLWRLVINLLMEPPRRKKLENINTFEDVVHLLKTCKKIMVLTGAGVSVSCGIPDFRSRDGVYARLAVDFPNLPDPQAMFDIHFFKGDQRPFFKFAKEIYPGQFEPSKCHKFIKLLDDHNKLLRNYTQNIDTLEQVAGIKNVIQCHGSFATAQCMACKHKVDADVIKKDIFDQVIPACPVCPPGTPYAIMKPNIVFFGESLPEEFHRQMADDKDECDLLIVIGSSLKVRPVALIPNSLPAHVPQILINRERLRHMDFDVELLGDCDVIVNELCKHLGEGWDKLSNNQPVLKHKEKSELCEDSKNMCSNIVSAYSCELRGDNCLSTDSNSSDSQSAVNHKQDTGDSQPTTPDVTPSTNTLDNRNSELCSNQSALRNSNSSETTDNDNIESTDETSNQMRSFFQPRPRQSLAKRLKNDELLFLPPNRYVFSGAEVYSDDDFDDSDSESEDGDEDTKTTNDDVQTENLDNQHQNDKVVPDVKAKENYEVSIRDIIDIAK